MAIRLSMIGLVPDAICEAFAGPNARACKRLLDNAMIGVDSWIISETAPEGAALACWLLEEKWRHT